MSETEVLDRSLSQLNTAVDRGDHLKRRREDKIEMKIQRWRDGEMEGR